MTLNLTLKLKIAFWTLLPPGAYRSVSQTHLDFSLLRTVSLVIFSVERSILVLVYLKNKYVYSCVVMI